MTEPAVLEPWRAIFALFLSVLFSGSVDAQPWAISAVPRNTGPVEIGDLHVLLNVDVQFQIFDFEANEKFCLVLGYVHEIEGEQPRRSSNNGVVCNLAGLHRLIVMMRPAGDKRQLIFGLHDRSTGAGSTRTFAELPISREITGSASFMAEQTIKSDQETTLFRWRFGSNPPHPDPHHDVRIVVRLDENDIGIGSYSKPNDFSQ